MQKKENQKVARVEETALLFMAPDLSLVTECKCSSLSSSQSFLHPLTSVITIVLGKLLLLCTFSGWYFHFIIILEFVLLPFYTTRI